MRKDLQESFEKLEKIELKLNQDFPSDAKPTELKRFPSFEFKSPLDQAQIKQLIKSELVAVKVVASEGLRSNPCSG